MPSYKASILITGGTNGMGYHAAAAIAKSKPSHLIVIASRTDNIHAADSINAANKQSNVVFMPLDLSSPSNVRAFAANWLADTSKPPIQVLAFNAGLQFPNALVLTPEGMEKTFAIAHVGHALLFHLLLPALVPTGARVVLTSSGTHDPAQKSGLPDAEYNTAAELAYPPKSKIDIPGRKRYSTAKLCNVLWTYALARHLTQSAPERRITVTAMDPGFMPGTGLAREAGATLQFIFKRILPHMIWFLRIAFNPNVHTPEASGKNLARLCVGADVEGVTGKYFEGAREIRSSEDSYDEGKQEDLWEWTVKYVAGGDEGMAERLKAFK